MNYKCRCCGELTWAENLEVAEARNGFCIVCDAIGEDGRKSYLKRKEDKEKEKLIDEAKKEYAKSHYNESVDLSKKVTIKKKDKDSNKVKVFRCLNDECGEYYLYSSWNKKCDKCNTRVQYIGKMSYKKYRQLKDVK